MFRFLNVTQGEEDWFEARLGKITASNFSKVLSPTGKVSTQITGLIDTLVAELLTGEREDTFKSDAMQRGSDLENEALKFVNFTGGYNFEAVGFADSGKGYGASPDGIDHEKKLGLELKVPLAKNHVKYLRAGKVPNEYFSQIQGSLLVTNYKQWVFCSYHPLMKPLVIVVDRDEGYINKLRELLVENCAKIQILVEELSNE